VNVAGSGREELGQVEFGFMGRHHDTTIIGVVDGDRIQGRTLVDDGSINGAKVGSAASVCNGKLVGQGKGGRTCIAIDASSDVDTKLQVGIDDMLARLSTREAGAVGFFPCCQLCWYRDGGMHTPSGVG
jgi:hypothetical protein